MPWGDDSANFFNDFIKDMVVANNVDAGGTLINNFSDFSPTENFSTSAAGPSAKPLLSCKCRRCFIRGLQGGPLVPELF